MDERPRDPSPVRTIQVIPGDVLALLCWSLLSRAASELKGQEKLFPEPEVHLSHQHLSPESVGK